MCWESESSRPPHVFSFCLFTRFAPSLDRANWHQTQVINMTDINVSLRHLRTLCCRLILRFLSRLPPFSAASIISRECLP